MTKESFGEDFNQELDNSSDEGFDNGDNDKRVSAEFRKPKNENIIVRWKNRQRMAWLSFWAMIAFTLLLWFVVPVWYNHMNVDGQVWTQNITDSSEWIYITFSGIILGYMGSTAWMVKGKDVRFNEDDY